MVKYQNHAKCRQLAEKSVWLYARRVFCQSNLWNEVIHPDDIGFIEKNQPAMRRGEPQSDKYRIKHKDGSWRW